MGTILVVEEDESTAQDIQRSLLRLGHKAPRTAKSRDEAIRAVEETQPDLILVGIKLKGKFDGIDTTEAIRKRWDLPVVYLTSDADEATWTRARDTGPHGYLLKPFNERDLRTAIDVAIRKHELQLNLSERERWFSTALGSGGDAVVATDRSERISFMNVVAERLTGWRREEAAGKELSEVLQLVTEQGARLDSQPARPLCDCFCARLPAHVVWEARHGTKLSVDPPSAALASDEVNPLDEVIVFREITGRKKLEQRLALSEHRASIGTMAAAMAHEIYNPVTAVVGNVGLASEMLDHVHGRLHRMPGSEELAREIQRVREALADAKEGAQRARRLVHDLKTLSRSDDQDIQVLDLPDVLDAAVHMTEDQVRQSVVVRREYATTPLVEANEGKLVQVFTILLLNAAQAASDGKSSVSHLRILTLTDDAGRAAVEIRDSSNGTPAQDSTRIFEPFAATQPAESGMGLGLSMCHSTIAALGGGLAVDSEGGRTTTFRVALPPAPRRTERRPRARPESVPVRRARVLVIDDEVVIVRTIERVLRSSHDVVIETDGRAALARVAAGENFDVILCDLMMPHLTGVEVYEAIARTRPDMAERVVFMTGGTFTPRTTRFLESVSNLTVSKPFTPEGLRAIVNDHVK